MVLFIFMRLRFLITWVCIKFFVGSPTPHSILDKEIDSEDAQYKDFFRLVRLIEHFIFSRIILLFSWYIFFVVQDHVEGYYNLSAKTKSFFSSAVRTWDAEFYVKIDDDVHVNLGIKLCFYFSFSSHWIKLLSIFLLTSLPLLGMLASTLGMHHHKPMVYIGCMISGPVLTQK